MHVFIANAGEIAIKAVGRMADILTVIGQIIFYVYPRKASTKDWQKNQIILFTWLHLNVSFSAYRKDRYGSNLWRYNRVTVNCLNNCWNLKYVNTGKVIVWGRTRKRFFAYVLLKFYINICFNSPFTQFHRGRLVCRSQGKWEAGLKTELLSLSF